jgi:hypothetical protein
MNLPLFSLKILAGPVLACFSQGRTIFPSVENCARLLGLALTDFDLAGEPCPLGLRYALLEIRPSHPLKKHYIYPVTQRAK